MTAARHSEDDADLPRDDAGNKSDASSLDPSAWLRAAADAIAEDGMNGLRVLPLAKRLGVTRGSFYWHFSDHAAFVTAFIDHWRNQQLRAIRNYVHQSTDAVEMYRQLLDTVLTNTERDLRRLRVEFALRGFARHHAYAAEAIGAVDRERVALFMPIFADICHSESEAEAYALLLLVQVSGTQHALAGPDFSVAKLASCKRAMLDALRVLRDARKQPA